MEAFEFIELQLDTHKQINLFSRPDRSGFCFIPATQQLIATIVANGLPIENETALLDFTLDAVLSSFYQLNQYYYFDNRSKVELRSIYVQLLQDSKTQLATGIDYNALAKRHYLRLQQWLIKNCPEAILLYPASMPLIENPVVCAEYTVPIQLQALGIDETTLMEPILDIGCGKEHHLVSYLQSRGFDVYGLDREALPDGRIFKESWLDFSYMPYTWGTIISHLGFSNHFRHQHLKQNGRYEPYAHTYINILHSLKVGGSFYYTPDLPFIEVFLNKEQFSIKRNKVQGTNFTATKATRLF